MWLSGINFRFLYLTLAFSSNIFAQQQYPIVNCPDIFKYSFDARYSGHYGLITVQRDGTAISEVEINMSVNTQGHIYHNLQIITLSKTEEFFSKDSILKYAVRFPVQNVIPKLISLKFNGKLICSGMADPLTTGVIQTNMWAKSTVRTFGPFHTQSFQSTQVIQVPPNKETQSPTVSPVNTGKIQSLVYTSTPTSKNAFTNPSYQCGIAGEYSESSPANTQEVRTGDFPWLAAIVYKQNSDYEFRCTGTLISDKHVVTAGHCGKNSSVPNGKNGNFLIILGKLKLENLTKTGAVRKIRSIVSNAESDIAIIVMNEPILFQSTIKPICLWKDGEDLAKIVGKSGTVIEWNKEGDGRVAKRIELSVVPWEQCLRTNKIVGAYAAASRIFCADSGTSVNALCGDDSGASFILKDDLSGKWFLRGLLGYTVRNPLSLSCGLSHYVLLTDLAKTRFWIEETMTKH